MFAILVVRGERKEPPSDRFRGSISLMRVVWGSGFSTAVSRLFPRARPSFGFCSISALSTRESVHRGQDEISEDQSKTLSCCSRDVAMTTYAARNSRQTSSWIYTSRDTTRKCRETQTGESTFEHLTFLYT